MPNIPTQRDLVLHLLQRHGIMRLSELKDHGVSPPTVSRLVHDGLVVRTARGQYELSDVEIDRAHALAEIAKRVPRGVICLISALQYHEITLQSPRSIWVAIGNKDREPKISHVSTRLVRFGDEAMSIGVGTHTIDV